MSHLKKLRQTQGFTLIEMLIVITIIGVLAAIVANSLGGFAGPKARDSVRIAELEQISTFISSLQNRFHTPPNISGVTATNKYYPENCQPGKGADKLYDCFVELRIDDPEPLKELFSDPKQGETVNNGKFAYYYGATSSAFKVCAFMEDTGGFENMNATSTGVQQSTVPSDADGKAYMHCIAQGTKAWDISGDKLAEITFSGGAPK